MSKKPRRQAGSVGTEPTGWRDAVMICRKCARKLDGGFGPDGTQSLRSALRDGLRKSGRRGQIGLLEVGCLGVCPKGAVTACLASAPGAFLVVARGAPAEAVLPRDRRADGLA